MAAMVLVAGYILALRDAPDDSMPTWRRNIRHVTSVVILVTIPVLAYAFGVATPAHQRAFVLSWTAAVWMLGVVVLLAAIDLVDGARLTRRVRRERRALLRAAERAIAAAIERSNDQDSDQSPAPAAGSATQPAPGERPRA
jgi:small-conductance mechanosensitive channel